MIFSPADLNTIHVIAHRFAQLQKHEDIRIRTVAQRCRAIEKLCESIRKGARDSAMQQAHRTLQKLMQNAIDVYKAKPNQDAPPGWS